MQLTTQTEISTVQYRTALQARFISYQAQTFAITLSTAQVFLNKTIYPMSTKMLL